MQSRVAIKKKGKEKMEKIIIIALILLWFAITLVIGYLLENASVAIKKRNRKNRPVSHTTERNIMILNSAGGNEYKKIAS